MPIGIPPTPGDQPTHRSLRRSPTTAEFVATGLAPTDDDDDEFVAPPFPPRRSSVPAVLSPGGQFAARRAQAVANAFKPTRASTGDPWYYRVSWSLGLASIATGGAILTLGFGVNRGHIGADQGVDSIICSSLAALIAGAGIMLLVDVARNIRRLRWDADRDAGRE